MHPRFTLTTLLAATAASVSAIAGPAPAPARPATKPASNLGPPPPNLDVRQDPPPVLTGLPTLQIPTPSPPTPSLPNPSPPSPSPPNPSPPNPSPPSPSPPNPSLPNPSPPNPLPTSCSASLTALLAGIPPPPTTAHPDLPAWASSSAPLQLVLSSITNNNLNPASAATTTVDIEALCSQAAGSATPPASLEAAYSQYLDTVQTWRYAVEGDAYALAERCGYGVGLGVELLMATEAAVCVSGLRASVAPWNTAGVLGGDGENLAVGRRGVGVGLVVGVVGVVAGVVGGVL